MSNLCKIILLISSGFIAAYLSIPLLYCLFGVTLTISGASLVGGMYLYTISSSLVYIAIGMMLLVTIMLIKRLLELLE